MREGGREGGGREGGRERERERERETERQRERGIRAPREAEAVAGARRLARRERAKVVRVGQLFDQ